MVLEDFKTSDLVLVKNGYGGRVTVGPDAEGAVRLAAQRVIVDPHDGLGIFEEFLVMHSINSQAYCQ